MTWRSGPCTDILGGGSALVSDGTGYARIDDADVRADEAERIRELALAGPDDDECDDDCTCGDDLG